MAPEVDPRAAQSELLELAGPAFAAKALAAAPVIVLVLDADGRIVHYNEFMERLCGRALAQTRGHDWFEVFVLDDERASTRALFEDLVASEPVNAHRTYVSRVQARYGESRLIEWQACKLERDDTITCMAIGVDISESEVHERVELAERFELFANQVDEALFVTNATRDRVLYLSPAFERITGVPCERVYESASVLAEMIHPEDRDEFVRALGSQPTGQIEREYRVLRRSGPADAEPELRWIWARYGLVSPGNAADTRIVGTLTDITQRKLAALELEQLGRTMALFDGAIDDAFVLLNASREEVVYASASAERMFGVSPQAAYTDIRALLSRVHPEDYERLLSVLGQTLPTDQRGTSYEYRVVSRDGELRWILSHLHTLDADSPMPGAVVSISMDITARHEAEDQLRQLTEELEGRVAERTSSLEFERRRLQQIIDAMAVHVGILDPDGRIQQLNTRARQAMDALPESVIGHTIDALPGVEYAPHSRADAHAGLELASVGQSARFDLETSSGAGDWAVTDTSLSPILDASGHLTEIVWTGLDVTDRRLDEQRLRESLLELELKEARLAGAQRIADVGDWDLDLTTNTLQWSDQIYRIFGRDPPDASARPQMSYDDFLVAVHPDDRAQVVAAHNHAITTGEIYEIEHRLVRPDGEVRSILKTGVFTRDQTGQPLRIQGTTQDITRQKSVEAQLRASLSEKEALLKEVHHRVKNNLQVVSSLLYLQGTNAEDRVRTVLDECRTRIRAMALVHEQLYVSGTLSEIEMHDFLTKLCEDLGHIYESSDYVPNIVVIGHGLVLDIERAIPVALMANELLTNALKYAYPGPLRFTTPPPQVRVYLNVDSLVVEDDGVGLPAELAELTTGSLGLRLVQLLARQLDATLEFAGKDGTRVCIRLPPKPGSVSS